MKVEDYINPILSTLVFTTFAILLYGIKGSKQVNENDKQGLNWFIRAFLLWAIVGFLTTIAVQFQWNENNLFIGLTVILSTFNSICFLKAVSFIQTKDKYWGSQFVNGITANWALIFASIFVLFGTVILVFAFGYERNHWIWSLDLAFSLVSVFALAIVIRQAFTEREMMNFNWLVYGMLSFLVLTQFMQLIQLTKDSHFYFQYSVFNIVVSLSYKIVFCMVILVLLYSWQILGFDKLSKSKINIEQENLDLKQKLEFASTQDEEISKLKAEIEEYKENFTAATGLPNKLLYASIKFVLNSESGYYGLKINPALSNEWIDVDFNPHLELFKRLFKLAIHKKHGNDKELWMPYNDGSRKTDLNDDQKFLNYFKEFRTKDKSEIIIFIKTHFPDFESTFLEQKSKQIRFSIIPENITLPPLEIGEGATPDDIFIEYLKEYKDLQARRGKSN